MKSTIKILIITLLLSANSFALVGDKAHSNTVTDSHEIVFKGNDKTEDDKVVETSCNSPTHEYGGEGCIDIR
ncbi:MULTISPECIES: hypothetical protein [Arsenophonus]|jgi:hypothetical protein|uniref:hypothetical protein n=1 Tax=Arsenophonus TaxID=637 RepID=UPI0038791815